MPSSLTKLCLYSYIRQSSVVDETFPPIENIEISRDLMTFVYSDSDMEDDDNCVDSMDNVESDWVWYPSGLMSFYSRDIRRHSE